MYSLRRVVAARFSLTMFLALALIAFWAFVGTEHVLREHLAKSLQAALDLTNATLGRGGMLPVELTVQDVDSFVRDVNRFIAIRDSAGRVVQGNVPAAFQLPLDTVSFRRALAGSRETATGDWRDGRVRSLYAPVPPTGHPGLRVVQVAASLTPFDQDSRRIVFLMVGTVLLGTLATLFGAWWLARSVVAPVLEVTAQANALTAGAPAQRITAHADVAEYAGLIGVLNDLLARVEQAFQSQRRLTADVGHELRTPLTALQGEFEIALRSERTARDYELVLRSGLEEIGRLTEMCDALLLITRADAKTLTPHRSPTDLNALAARTLDAQRKRIKEKDLRVTRRLTYPDEAVALDGKLVAKMLQQLVDNAVKFSPVGGAIGVGAERTERGARLWVEDSGPGIPGTDLPNIFEPFYRADEARTRGDGTGLGLSMALAVAKLHDGTIRAENLAGGGARFEVELPVETG